MSPQALIIHVHHDNLVWMILESEQLWKCHVSRDIRRREVYSLFDMKLIVICLLSQV
jgi:hypothetical protein